MAGLISARTKRLVMPFHRWTGLVAGLFLMLTALSGLLIQWDTEILKLGFEQDKWAASQTCDRCPLADAAERVIADAPGTITTLSLRPPDLANTAIQATVSYRGKGGVVVERLLAIDPVTLAVTGWADGSGLARRVVETIYELHYSLILGLVGSVVVLCLGIALSTLAATGVIMWWPAMRNIATAFRPVVGLKDSNWLLDRHRLTGLYSSALILVIAVTGIVTSVRVVLASIGPEEAAVARPLLRSAIAPKTAEAIALQTWPRAHYAGLDLPTVDRPTYEVSFVWPGEPTAHIGLSWLSIDARNGAVTQRYVQPKAETSQRLLDLMIPLHSGEVFGLAGRLSNMVAGIAILFLFVTGCARWRRRRAKTQTHKLGGERI